MFCSTCGNQLSTGLSFCNKCGAPIGTAKEKSRERDPDQLSESSTNFLIAGMLGIPIAGTGIIIALATVLKKELQMDTDAVLLIITMAFALMIMAELGFLFLLFTRTRSNKKFRAALAEKENRSQVQLKEGVTNSLNEAKGQPIGSAASVTENTTRALDPVYREPER